jgi:hypothetical protein
MNGRAPRVLCYSPYNLWTLHGLWEMTVLHALGLRGAEVHYVLCDALYVECDVFWAATDPRKPTSCLTCQAHVARLVSQMAVPYEWLGRYVLPHELRLARAWAQELAPADFAQARYGDWDVGEWIRSSVHSHFRASTLDLERPEICQAYRAYLEGGAVAAFALERLLEESAPDVLFLFSGRLSSTRVALELALRRGVRVVCHERGLLRDSLKLFEDTHSLALAPIQRIWQDWGDVPLRAEQLERVWRYMAQRARGENVGERTFSPPLQDLAEVRRRLGLAPERPLWVLFTSSEDEVIATPERAGPFVTQLAWVRATLQYARAHPELDLAIRVHPNIGGARSIGKNTGQLRELEALRAELPRNAYLVLPDDPVSSYSLMELAQVGLVYISITGLELACRGKSVVVAAGAWVRDLPFVQTVRDAGSYASVLDRVRSASNAAQAHDIARAACRFAYGLYFRWNIPFPLVRMRDAHNGELAYASLDALAPGQCQELDRICRILLEREAVCARPSEVDRTASDREEHQWFEMQLGAKPPRALEREAGAAACSPFV